MNTSEKHEEIIRKLNEEYERRERHINTALSEEDSVDELFTFLGMNPGRFVDIHAPDTLGVGGKLIEAGRLDMAIKFDSLYYGPEEHNLRYSPLGSSEKASYPRYVTKNGTEFIFLSAFYRSSEEKIYIRCVSITPMGKVDRYQVQVWLLRKYLTLTNEAETPKPTFWSRILSFLA